jgi:D-xylonolactonase
MFRYTPATGQHEQCYEGQPIGGLTIQADGALLLFMTRGTVKAWRDGQMTTILEEIPEERETQFNDVIADPLGCVFCGTLPTKDRLGRLYRLDPDGTLTILLEGIGCSNGMGFSPDRTQMYYTDSPKHEVYRFDYDKATGALSNQVVFARNPESEGLPDGMTVDAEGYVWSARWDGDCVVRFAPDGREERRVAFPARKCSSVTFGGEDYGDMYVTTAGGDQKATDGALAGALFRVRLGILGVPEFRSRVGL